MSRDREGAVSVFEHAGVEYLTLSVPLAAPADLPLSTGEREVVGMILQGLSNAEIAARRGTALRTVANQVARVFEKLGVQSRAELVARLNGV